MIRRREILFAAASLGLAPAALAAPRLTNFRFGILKQVEDEVFEFVRETKVLPLKTRDTGFLFGIGFDNPDGGQIEWYEIVHLPSNARRVSGNFHRSSKRHLRTKTNVSSRRSIVDEFYFDEGDPLGRHTMDLVVNGVLVHQVQFEVVKA